MLPKPFECLDLIGYSEGRGYHAPKPETERFSFLLDNPRIWTSEDVFTGYAARRGKLKPYHNAAAQRPAV